MRSKKTRTKKNGTTQSQSYLKADSHNYYRGLTKQQANEADKVAHDIAQAIMAEKKLDSDLKRVKVATRIVAGFCSRNQYMMSIIARLTEFSRVLELRAS